MNPEIRRELQEAMDDLLRQRRLRAEARERLTAAVTAEYDRRYGAGQSSPGEIRAVVDARMGKEWETNGRTLDYQWAQREVQTWAALATVELLTDIRKDLTEIRRDRLRPR